LTGIDRTTAFFATVPGGVIETTNLAPQYGGHLEPIMVAQTTRVALIVVFAPFLVVSFAGGGARNPYLATAVGPSPPPPPLSAPPPRGAPTFSPAPAPPQCRREGAAVPRRGCGPLGADRRPHARPAADRRAGGDWQRAWRAVPAGVSPPPVRSLMGLMRGRAV